MGGNIVRLPGEKFADFARRQREAQVQAKAQHDAEIKSQRAMRKARRTAFREVSDFDYSMNAP